VDVRKGNIGLSTTGGVVRLEGHLIGNFEVSRWGESVLREEKGEKSGKLRGHCEGVRERVLKKENTTSPLRNQNVWEKEPLSVDQCS